MPSYCLANYFIKTTKNNYSKVKRKTQINERCHKTCTVLHIPFKLGRFAYVSQIPQKKVIVKQYYRTFSAAKASIHICSSTFTGFI